MVELGDAGRAFADALPDGILIADQHARIVFANAQQVPMVVRGGRRRGERPRRRDTKKR